MLQLEKISDFEWRRTIERLDKAVAAGARKYLQSLHNRRETLGGTLRQKSSDRRIPDGLRIHIEPLPRGFQCRKSVTDDFGKALPRLGVLGEPVVPGELVPQIGDRGGTQETE